nr:cytochrome c oxidase subunit II [Mesorhizobium liriopis]
MVSRAVWPAVLLPLPLLCGCSSTQSPLFPAGQQAANLYDLLLLMSMVCGTIYVLVLGFLVLSLVRKRRASVAPNTVVAPPDKGLRHVLVVWSGFIIAALSVLVLGSFLADRGLARMQDAEVLDVRVNGHQWWWRIAYREPGGTSWIETANELHLPIDRTTRIQLVSGDVIHSFWVPNLAGKTDVVPGRNNSLDLTPRKTGWFRGQCAEYCGLQHAHMALDVKVDTAGEFAAWIARQKETAHPPTGDAVASRGLALIETGTCGLCHTIRGTAAQGRAGPDLTHIASRHSLAAGSLPMSRGALQGWIAQPQAVKPGTLMPFIPLEPADLNAIAHYLEQRQ